MCHLVFPLFCSWTLWSYCDIAENWRYTQITLIYNSFKNIILLSWTYSSEKKIHFDDSGSSLYLHQSTGYLPVTDEACNRDQPWSLLHFLVLISFPRPNHDLFMFSLSWFLSVDNPPHPPPVINHRPRITVGFGYINFACSYSIEILLMATIEPRPSPQGGEEAHLREKMAAVWGHFHLLPIILISIIFMHIRSFSPFQDPEPTDIFPSDHLHHGEQT